MASSQGMQLQLQPIITMLVLVQVVVVVVLSLSAATIAAPPTEQDLKNLGCLNRCGNVSISYLFGVKEKCYINEHFLINCTDSKPYLRKSDIPVANILLEEGELGIMHPVTCACYGGGLCHKVISHQRSGYLHSPYLIPKTSSLLLVVTPVLLSKYLERIILLPPGVSPNVAQSITFPDGPCGPPSLKESAL